MIHETLLYLCMAKKIKTGRKKVEPAEKVILVGFYTKRKFVDSCGGMEQARMIAKIAIDTFHLSGIDSKVFDKIH